MVVVAHQLHGERRLLVGVGREAELGERCVVGGGNNRAWIAPDNTSLTEFRFAPNPYENKATLPVQLVRYNDHAHLGALERKPHSI